MEVKEAIRRIKDHFRIHDDDRPTPYLDEAVDMAIKALEKQILKQPIIWENKSYDAPVPNDDWGYECPCCGNQDIDYPDHHCTCGQALDWKGFD